MPSGGKLPDGHDLPAGGDLRNGALTSSHDEVIARGRVPLDSGRLELRLRDGPGEFNGGEGDGAAQVPALGQGDGEGAVEGVSRRGGVDRFNGKGRENSSSSPLP